MKSQKENILEYLKQGHSITPIEALNKFGCFRLAAVVFDLKVEANLIITTMIDDKKTGKRYAQYTLDTLF